MRAQDTVQSAHHICGNAIRSTRVVCSGKFGHCSRQLRKRHLINRSVMEAETFQGRRDSRGVQGPLKRWCQRDACPSICSRNLGEEHRSLKSVARPVEMPENSKGCAYRTRRIFSCSELPNICSNIHPLRVRELFEPFESFRSFQSDSSGECPSKDGVATWTALTLR